MTLYDLHVTYRCADDGQAERIGVAMGELLAAEFDSTAFHITRVVPIGPPAYDERTFGEPK